MKSWRKVLLLAAASTLAWASVATAYPSYGSCTFSSCGGDGPTYQDTYVDIYQCCSSAPRTCPDGDTVVFPASWNGYGSTGPEVCWM
jgi:hypothetical protein